MIRRSCFFIFYFFSFIFNFVASGYCGDLGIVSSLMPHEEPFSF